MRTAAYTVTRTDPDGRLSACRGARRMLRNATVTL
jgi:hypothetical protein